MTTRLLVAISVAALAIAAAGCGGGDESSSETIEAAPASEWAAGFCGAVTTWKSELESITGQFSDLSSFSQDGLETAAADLRTATDQLVEDLKGLGTPDTESGEDVKSSIDEFATSVESELDAIQTAVDETSGITELPGAVQDVLSSLGVMSSAFSSMLSAIGDADVKSELEDALEASPACDEITG